MAVSFYKVKENHNLSQGEVSVYLIMYLTLCQILAEFERPKQRVLKLLMLM